MVLHMPISGSVVLGHTVLRVLNDRVVHALPENARPGCLDLLVRPGPRIWRLLGIQVSSGAIRIYYNARLFSDK